MYCVLMHIVKAPKGLGRVSQRTTPILFQRKLNEGVNPLQLSNVISYSQRRFLYYSIYAYRSFDIILFDIQVSKKFFEIAKSDSFLGHPTQRNFIRP